MESEVTIDLSEGEEEEVKFRLASGESEEKGSRQPNESVELPSRIELETGERPVLMTRQHWYVFRDPLLVAFFVPFVLLSGAFFVEYTTLPVVLVNGAQTALTWLAGVAFVVGMLMSLWRYFLWRRTFYAITNKRVVLVTQHGMFTHDDRETSLSMIQDVKAEVPGLQPTLYGYGNVVIQVSSEDSRLIFERVGKPHEIQRVIMREAHLREG